MIWRPVVVLIGAYACGIVVGASHDWLGFSVVAPMAALGWWIGGWETDGWAA